MNGARALLLAAGRGRRAGGPKAWRDYEGTTILEAHLNFFRGLIGAASVSVAIQPEWRERCAALSPETVWVDADPDAAPLDSLQRLIAASPSARSFVLHVDMPVFEPEVYEALWARGEEILVPVCEGRRGHPVLLAGTALARTLRLDPKTDRLDAWLRTQGVFEVPVAAGAILRNLNEAAA
jgi:CTP:molybdopterin cytidylyltransferase MocA